MTIYTDSRTGALRRRCHLTIDADVYATLEVVAAAEGTSPTTLGALLFTGAVRAAQAAQEEAHARADLVASLTAAAKP